MKPAGRRWRQKCRANKRDGTPCQAWAICGAVVCRKHGGTLPVVRAKAARVMAEVKRGCELSVADLTMPRHESSVRLKAARQLFRWANSTTASKEVQQAMAQFKAEFIEEEGQEALDEFLRQVAS